MMLAAIVKFLLHYVVFALMLSIGLAVRRGDLRQIVRKPQLYVRALLVMELGIPLLAMAVVAVLPLSRQATTLILLMAVCPGAPLIPSATKVEGESHSEVGLNLLVLTSILAPVMIPIWLSILNHAFSLDLGITPVQVLENVVPAVILPLVLGFIVRQLWPRAADVVWRVAHYFFLAAFAVALGLVLYLGVPVLLQVAAITFIAVLILIAGSAVMGYWAATPQPDERRTTSVAAVLGNPGLALAIVAVSYPGFKAAAFVAAYLIFRKLALIPFEQWLKHRKRPSAHPPAAGARHAVGTT